MTDVDYSTISDVVLHIQYTADSGPASLDGPPTLLAFVDLRQMDSEAWAALVSGSNHRCTLAVADLVPRFLADYRVQSIASESAAILSDGTVVTGKLSFSTGASTAAAPSGTVTIELQAGETLSWADLARVFIVVNMAP